MVIALGVIPAVAEDSAQDLIAELAVIDAEPETAPGIVPASDTDACGDGRPEAGTGTDTGEEPVAAHASVVDLAARYAEVAWAPDRDLWHELLYRLSGRRLYRRYRTPARLPAGAPWIDAPSGARHTWRTRAAYLAGEFAFGVDYQVCRVCTLGWVEDRVHLTWSCADVSTDTSRHDDDLYAASCQRYVADASTSSF
ncbi:hypothetical protein AB0K48_44410 [Nonomuraea sp. NPDC055795]